MNTQKLSRTCRSRRAGRRLVLLAAALALTAGTASGASATTHTEPDATVGEITVAPTTGLPETGAVVTVTGTGFDTAAGIYVAVCVDNGPDVKPSPCIGGADTAGTGGATWISDNPPSYAEGLTQPYGPDGSFALELPVPMVDPVTGTDCRVVTCAVTTRYDHVRGEDRGADNVVPVTFGGAASPHPADAVGVPDAADGAQASDDAAPTDDALPSGDAAPTDGAHAAGTAGSAATSDDENGFSAAIAAGAGAVVVLGAAAWLFLRRRSASRTDRRPGSPSSPGSTTAEP